MSDSHDQWNHESYENEGSNGLLWRTARNVAVLLAACLLLLGVMNWGSDRVTEPAHEQSRNTGSAPAQISRTTVTGAEIIIPAGRNGHFLIDAEVEEVEIQFLVDTGATQVILTLEDAERLGYGVETLEFSDRFQTANGTISGAPLVLSELRIGDLEIEDVRASVIRAPMSTSLLGMSFLKRLESFEVGAEGLILRW